MAFDGSKEAIKREQARINNASSIKTGVGSWAAQQIAQRESWERHHLAARKKTPEQLHAEFLHLSFLVENTRWEHEKLQKR
jgi:hypothetical protein